MCILIALDGHCLAARPGTGSSRCTVFCRADSFRIGTRSFGYPSEVQFHPDAMAYRRAEQIRGFADDFFSGFGCRVEFDLPEYRAPEVREVFHPCARKNVVITGAVWTNRDELNRSCEECELFSSNVDSCKQAYSGRAQKMLGRSLEQYRLFFSRIDPAIDSDTLRALIHFGEKYREMVSLSRKVTELLSVDSLVADSIANLEMVEEYRERIVQAVSEYRLLRELVSRNFPDIRTINTRDTHKSSGYFARFKSQNIESEEHALYLFVRFVSYPIPPDDIQKLRELAKDKPVLETVLRLSDLLGPGPDGRYFDPVLATIDSAIMAIEALDEEDKRLICTSALLFGATVGKLIRSIVYGYVLAPNGEVFLEALGSRRFRAFRKGMDRRWRWVKENSGLLMYDDVSYRFAYHLDLLDTLLDR